MNIMQAQVPPTTNPVSAANPAPTASGAPVSSLPETVIPHKQPIFHFTGMLLLAWNRVALALLLFEGAHGLWESIKFFAIEYPEFNQQLEAGTLSQQDVSSLLITAGLIITITIISITLAVRLRHVHETLSHTLELVFSSVFIIAAYFAKQSLGSIDILAIFWTRL
jgi:hypothetical protein